MIYLMGNKSDLIEEDPSRKKVSWEMIKKFCEYNDVYKSNECSAKLKYNLVEPFEEMCKGIVFFLLFFLEIYRKQKILLEEKSNIRKHFIEQKKPKSGCC